MPCRERDTVMTPSIFFKEFFTNKGEILSCKSVRPCKNRKNSRAYYVRTRGKSGSNSPPFQRNVQIPPSLGTKHSQMPGVCPGGMLKFRVDRRIKLTRRKQNSSVGSLCSPLGFPCVFQNTARMNSELLFCYVPVTFVYFIVNFIPLIGPPRI